MHQIRIITTSQFQSTPPARGATPLVYDDSLSYYISIHAPREGGDFARELKGQRYIFISIHAPREGGDLGVLGYAANSDLFQSTPPARGATKSIQGCRCFLSYFNPRPPRGGRRDDPAGRLGDVVFQSTPPARGATILGSNSWNFLLFQSTPPARGATLSLCLLNAASLYFNPRPPRGGRHTGG